MGSGVSYAMNIYDLFNMGGYAWYVWPAYGITFLVFGFNLFLFAREKKQVKKILHSLSNQSK